ncbi:MAG: hypothetical protein ACI9MR_000930 [Myxococcota bacterium]|jgi:hypothetical protein
MMTTILPTTADVADPIDRILAHARHAIEHGESPDAIYLDLIGRGISPALAREVVLRAERGVCSASPAGHGRIAVGLGLMTAGTVGAIVTADSADTNAFFVATTVLLAAGVVIFFQGLFASRR